MKTKRFYQSMKSFNHEHEGADTPTGVPIRVVRRHSPVAVEIPKPRHLVGISEAERQERTLRERFAGTTPQGRATIRMSGFKILKAIALDADEALAKISAFFPEELHAAICEAEVSIRRNELCARAACHLQATWRLTPINTRTRRSNPNA